MKIRRIKVKNFRNLKNIDIIPSKTTVLIGENNTGKSNLLHAMRLLLGVNARRLESDITEEDINTEAFAQGEKEFSIIIEIGDLQDHPALEAIFRERLFKDNNETYITIEGKYEFNEDSGYDWYVSLLPSPERSNEPIPYYAKKARHIPLYFLDAVRNAEREMRARGRGTLADLLRDIKLEDIKDDIISYIHQANITLQSNNEIKELATDISDLLKSYVVSGQGEISFSVATEDPADLIKNLTLAFKRPFDLRRFDMFKHGTGLQNLVLISIFRYKISQSDITFPILAIEEPEAHLHPQSQVCLFKEVEMIKNPVFMTTHSPTIVNHVDPLNIILLKESESGEITTHQLKKALINENDIKSFKKFIRLGSSYALFSRVIIIVEGYSEAILLPVFAEVINANLFRDGVSIVPAYGSSFSFLINVCKEAHFSISTVITYDTDVLENNNNLLNEACKAGLLTRAQRDSWKAATDIPSERQSVLESIGWISVEKNLEQELGNAGYFDLILSFLDDFRATQAFDDYISTNGLTKDPYSVGLFISKKRKDLKVPLAYFIADAVPSEKHIPNCFREAITRAIILSTGGTFS